MVKAVKTGAKKAVPSKVPKTAKSSKEIKSKPITSSKKPTPAVKPQVKKNAKKPIEEKAKVSQVKSKTPPKKVPVPVKSISAVSSRSKSQDKAKVPIKSSPAPTKRQSSASPAPVSKKQKTSDTKAVIKSNQPTKAKPAPAPVPDVKNAKKSSGNDKKPQKAGIKPSTPKPSTPATSKTAKNPTDTPTEKPKMVTAVRKGRAAVDVECPKAKDCHVYEEGATVWTVTLNQADLGHNANKYYIIQLLQSDASQNTYYVWNRWGRVGYSGQNALKGPFGDLNRAKMDYQSKLRDKTRGGYIEVQIVYGEENEPKPEPPKAQKGKKKTEEVKSKLNQNVSDLVNLIFDLKSINRTLAEIGYDSKKMPLGKLSTVTIKQGLEVLKTIENALSLKRTHELESLSSRFYSLIPHDFGFQKMSNFIINSNEKVKQKVEMLESLADMKIATNILEATVSGSPVDSHYEKLNCKITPLEKKDPIYDMLVQYVKNTHGDTHSYYTLTVEDIFKIEKPGEKEKFTEKIPNHMLLWHGSRLTNWVGILSQGLRIAPPEAPVSGYMFGKGVYFADMVSKSANYCFTSKDNNTGILLLCEVAVGNFNPKIHSDYNAANLPKGKNSTKGCGLCAPPEKSYKKFEGYSIPMGPGEKVTLNGGYLQYNEYIVYDTKQIKMKFLFRVKFNYKY
ncbi:hypothetical protein SteCoe_23903 [Stentor coeruleus]|uniref:Poly [ADP-ribose] polymerase n=1 Tax=Stentor coeruleus TaxID=5963 RepID=A0A1R2BJ91_9CILI|nr:hypothetical protein SteCoe_27180 [Stentor coeruleus]OMJ76675.1 hypothetical protein SteCoe_23903 [Stentor coeruleus]